MSRLCERARMSRQNYYKQRQEREKTQVDEALIRHLVLDERHVQPRLGGRKLHCLLQGKLADNGVKIGRDEFFKALGRMELLLDPLPKAPRTTMSRHNLPHYGNTFKCLELSAPNQAYVSDITYIRTAGRFLYLALIMDDYSRKVVGYHLGKWTATTHDRVLQASGLTAPQLQVLFGGLLCVCRAAARSRAPAAQLAKDMQQDLKVGHAVLGRC